MIEHLFSPSIDQQSPVQEDFVRKVNYDEDGNEFITFEKFDYPSFQKSLGSVNDWSLSSLLEAGIDPSFPIHTGANTRLDGIDSLKDWSAAADVILNENNNE